ncbi:MAG: ABC transporter ATP-binding protein [Anaerocolumna sp.]
MQLIVENINKTIKDKRILVDISLNLESGNVYGIVGRNGSGKTMLFRALSGLMRIDSGTITYDRKVLHKDISMLPNLGIVLENAGLYTEYTGLKNLQLLAALHNKIKKDQIIKAITRVGLDPNDKRILKKYSLGMKQRIVIAQSIMEKPSVLLLDEPTNALDEGGVELIRNVILEEKKRGALVLVASHSKEDIDILSDQVFYMDKGSIVERKG